MRRWMIVAVLAVAGPASAPGQYSPYAPVQKADPRLKRAWREQAVAYAGPTARDLVDTYGDDACVAVFACTKGVAQKLAQFHLSGGLAKLPQPAHLLRVIAQPNHGDDVALWAMARAEELTDPDNLKAYLLSPLDYALGLKPLSQGAAEVRAARLSTLAAPPAANTWQGHWDGRVIVGVIAFAVIVGLVCWRNRKRS